ncbi:MAG: FkbM family methyltransferase [Candidatus Paceibacterota bacterium]|jgi:FkbM family methyltransferase
MNNPLKLKFASPGWEEDFIMDEIQTEYAPDTWGLCSGDVIIEIGGHTGEVSMTLAKKYGAKVFVFEPSPINYAKLMTNIKSNKLTKLITVFNLALTGDGRDVCINMVKNSGAHRIGKAGPVVKSVTFKEALQMCRLDKPPAVVVMDCEGAEFEILEDLEPFKGIKMLRGEFHGNFNSGNIDKLLARARTVIPDCQTTMTYGASK